MKQLMILCLLLLSVWPAQCADAQSRDRRAEGGSTAWSI